MKKIDTFSFHYNVLDVYEVNGIYAYYVHKHYCLNNSWMRKLKEFLYSKAIFTLPIYLKCEVTFFEEGLEFCFSEYDRYFYAYDAIKSCFNKEGYIVFSLKKPIKSNMLEIETPFIIYRNFDQKVLKKLDSILSEKIEGCTINTEELYELKKRGGFSFLKQITWRDMLTFAFLFLLFVLIFK